MNSIINELAHETLEAVNSSENRRRLALWEKHNNLEGCGTVPVNVHLWKIGDSDVWYEIIPRSSIFSNDVDSAFVETALRRRLFKFNQIEDDDVILPTIWVTPILMDISPSYGCNITGYV